MKSRVLFVISIYYFDERIRALLDCSIYAAEGLSEKDLLCMTFFLFDP